MKNLIIILLLLTLVFSTESYSQNDRSGNKGLIFSLANATTGNYEGGIGGKIYFSKDVAGRLGFGLAIGKDFTSINLAPGITFNMIVSKPVTFYTGAEMLIKSNGGDSNPNAGFQFGLGALAGAEWMVDKNVSISGEYYLLSMIINSPKGADSNFGVAIGAYAKMLLTFYF